MSYDEFCAVRYCEMAEKDLKYWSNFFQGLGFRVLVSCLGSQVQGWGFGFCKMLIVFIFMAKCSVEVGSMNALSTIMDMCLLCRFVVLHLSQFFLTLCVICCVLRILTIVLQLMKHNYL